MLTALLVFKFSLILSFKHSNLFLRSDFLLRDDKLPIVHVTLTSNI